MIQIRQLSKMFGPFTAVDNVSLDVKPGEVLGFLGPNGAGKSTTMKMVTGYLTPTSGSATVCGHDVTKDPLAVKHAIGYLPEGAPAYPDMTPESFLNFIASVRGLSGSERSSRINQVVERVQLQDVMRQSIDTLSKGFKRRVGLAQAILHDPDVLIMDEPTDGLDPNQKHEVRSLIREMASRGGKAIVLSTHILEEVDAVCTRTVLINRGKIVFDGTAHDFQKKSRYHNAVSFSIAGPAGSTPSHEAVTKELSALPAVASVENLSSAAGVVTCTVLSKNRAPIVNDLTTLARKCGWDVRGLAVDAGRMDDVFRELTTSGGAR